MSIAKVWDGTNWVPAIIGARGPDGPQGDVGPQGPQGDDFAPRTTC